MEDEEKGIKCEIQVLGTEAKQPNGEQFTYQVYINQTIPNFTYMPRNAKEISHRLVMRAAMAESAEEFIPEKSKLMRKPASSLLL